MSKLQMRKEAITRQGANVEFGSRKLRIAGGSSQAEFEMGSEGLVHLATDENDGERFRIKCFWDPHSQRRQRSEHLVNLQLADLNKSKADSLGGAPFGMLPELGPFTPFAVIMKNVRGENWRKMRGRIQDDPQYPPAWWPAPEIRATWGYGLATAVKKMEDRGFIHADLSPGNIVVNDGLHGLPDSLPGASTPALGEDESGDIALVDFDRYMHSSGGLPEPGKGSEGYAAPEIWQKQTPHLGTDRTAMAILIQELLVVGDADISKAEALDWGYDQEAQLFEWFFRQETPASPQGQAHPLLESKYPGLAKLVRETLDASSPAARPVPESWRQLLRAIATGTEVQPSKRSTGLLIEPDPTRPSVTGISFGPAKQSLDLSTTGFRIKATLERDAGGSIYLVVHDGATVNVQSADSKRWTRYSGGARLVADVGMIVFDPEGAMKIRLSRPR